MTDGKHDDTDPMLSPTQAATGPSSRPSASPLRAPGYELGAVIGRGGMGEVLLARDARIGRDVAIKRLLVADPSSDAVARFLREARIQARLDHPSIVPVHELGEDAEGRPFFTMKRLAGVTLADRLSDPTADIRRLLDAFVDVCAAIELAHARDVVHRDLKPANIMLGDFREVYVLDWGIARVLGESDVAAPTGPSEPASEKTQVGAVLGTPMYMAPEQLRGEPVGPAADVFALGCVLFEILAREPLRKDNRADDNSPLPDRSPSHRRPDRGIAPELDDTCLAALAEDPAARPTARALGDRVQHYLDGDRDLAHRRKLAAEHLASARGALDKGDRAGAMQHAGRALALDPESEAPALIGSLLVEPPAVLPTELQDKLAETDRGYARQQWRAAAWTYGGFFAFFPMLVWEGVTDWKILGAILVALVVLAVHAIRGARHGEQRAWPAMLLSGLVVILTARTASPFIFVPGVICVMCSSWFAYPPMMRYPWRTYGFVLATGMTPFALELVGVFPSTWRVQGDELIVKSHLVHLSEPRTSVLLVLSTAATISIAAYFGRALAEARRSAQQKVEIQAWHLNKLVGR
jgi:serine/threonine-protein kinase